MITWADLVEYFTKFWVIVIVPFLAFLEKKRREFSSLNQKVEQLEVKVEVLSDKIDQDRVEREARRLEDERYRKTTTDKIDKIYDIVIDVQTKTAINSTKLDERK